MAVVSITSLRDTAGQEEYRRLRMLSFPNTDVFLICFSLVDPKSFNHALNKWLPEVQEQCPNAIKIFVGTKTDLFREEDQKINMRHRPIVLPESIVVIYQIQMRSKIAATGHQFLMCSALCQDGLTHVFDESIRQTIRKRFEVGRMRKKKDQDAKCQLI